MMILLVLGFFVLFLLADLAARELLRRRREKLLRREREEALAVSLRLDFSRESKTLKRVEVKDPVGRILCVDDEAVVLDSFRKILVMGGFSVDTVGTGQEALALVQANHYDFVFTDLKMPAMPGLEVVKAVNHMRPDIDVVVITGYATVDSAVECMKYGAMDYVEKPFGEDELLAFVKKANIKRRDRMEKRLKPRVHVTHAGTRSPEAEVDEFHIPGGALISRGHAWATLAQEGGARIGLDDFAKKIIGTVDSVEFPNVGMSVKAGQVLFSVRRRGRVARFYAPLSGKVMRINGKLLEDPQALDETPYEDNWVCEVDPDDLDAELPALRIGKSAVALYQEDIERFRELMREIAPASMRSKDPYAGELGDLNDDQWERAVKEFFQRRDAAAASN
jgi:CheY-like chemotaxis protein